MAVAMSNRLERSPGRLQRDRKNIATRGRKKDVPVTTLEESFSVSTVGTVGTAQTAHFHRQGGSAPLGARIFDRRGQDQPFNAGSVGDATPVAGKAFGSSACGSRPFRRATVGRARACCNRER